MRTVTVVARAQLRRRRAATIGLVVLVGLAGGVVMAAAAGARRTESAFPRMVGSAGTSDLVVQSERPLDLAALEGLDGVIAARGAIGLGLAAAGPDGIPDVDANPGALASASGALFESDRPVVLEGRRPDPDREDEVLVNERAADQFDLRPGDVAEFSLFRFDELQALFESVEGEPTDEDFERLRAILTPVELAVTGIGRSTGEVVANENQQLANVVLTPAFARAHADLANYHWTYLDLADGRRSPALQAALDRQGAEDVQNRASLLATVRQAVGPYHDALLAFAVVGGLTALLIIGQAMVRQTIADAAGDGALRSIGLTRGQRALGTAARGGVAIAAGTALAVVVAVVASPLFPVGPAQRAEAVGGIEVDLVVLTAGALALLTVLGSVTLASAWHQTGPVGDGLAVRRRPPRTVTALEAAVPTSPTVIGVGMALRPVGGTAAAARTSTLVGLGVAVTAVVAALTFGASLDNLVSSPAAYGWTWDAVFETYDNGLDPDLSEEIAADPSVRARTEAGRAAVVLDGEAVSAYGFRPAGPSPLPAITAGRFPSAPDEVALGAATLARLDRSIGDTVTARAAGNAAELSIVGRVVTPSLNLDDTYGLADSAVLTLDGLRALRPDLEPTFLLVEFTDDAGADPVAGAEERYRERGGTFLELQRPGDITAFAGVRRTPVLLAGLLSVLGLGVLAHGLWIGVRSHRRGLAVLKSIGFTRRQVRSVVGWQAATLVAAATLFAVPLGVAGGRLAWQVLARRLGVPADPVLPLTAVALVVLGTLLAGQLIAAWPARQASRTRAATVLRAE